MDTALATVFGVAIGSLLALFGNYLNNRHSLRQQREQWEREEKKAQREEEERRRNKEIEVQQQFKANLREIYANSIRYLAEIYNYAKATKDGNRYVELEKKLYSDIAEAHKWLALLTMHYYDKEDARFKRFYVEYSENLFSNRENYEYFDDLRRYVLDFATKDPRLQ